MSFLKSIFKGKEAPQDNIPSMKLGNDASNAWYDEKAKKWRFKGEEIKEEDTVRSVLPPKMKMKEENIKSISNNTDHDKNLISAKDTKEIILNDLKNESFTNTMGNDQSNAPINSSKFELKKNDINNIQLRNDPNSSVYFSCNEDRIQEEMRKYNIELIRQEKDKLEDHYRRNLSNYERNLKDCDIKLKELEKSNQEFLSNYTAEKDKIQVDIKKMVLENIKSKFTTENMNENIKVLEKENETCRQLIKEYRNLIDSHNSDNLYKEDETAEKISSVEDNFKEILNLEMNEKSNLIKELMDSYLIIAQLEKRNNNLLNNLNSIRLSCKNLTLQEKRLNEYIDNFKIEFSKEKEIIYTKNEKEKNKIVEEFNQKLLLKEEEIQNEKVSSSIINSKNLEIEKNEGKIKYIEDQINVLTVQQKLIVDEKNKKIDELLQKTLYQQFEIEDTNQNLQQYKNFDTEYKDKINKQNELIFKNENNMKSYDLNLKSLKTSLQGLFGKNNIGDIDNKIFSKVDEINLFKSHDEIYYIIKCFINEFIRNKDEKNFYIKEKKAMETDITNLTVENNIYKEHNDEKNLKYIQLQEISNLLKERITSLEEENAGIKSKLSDSNKEMIEKIKEEIIILNENLKEKDLIITSLNNSINYFNEKISNLEKNNFYLEKNCENLSRYEKYSEMLETEKTDLQKIIIGLKNELDKKNSRLDERETLLNSILEETIKVGSFDKDFVSNNSHYEKEIILSNSIKKLSEIILSFQLEKQYLEKENIFYKQEIQRSLDSKELLQNEINIINENKSLIQSELNTIKGLFEEKNKQISVQLEDYALLEEKSEKLMELIQKNKESYDQKIDRLTNKNNKKIEKLASDLKAKFEENELLHKKLEEISINCNEQINLLQSHNENQNLVINQLESSENVSKENFIQIIMQFIDHFDKDHKDYLNSINSKEISLETCIECLKVLLEKLNSSIKGSKNQSDEIGSLREENARLFKNGEKSLEEKKNLKDENVKLSKNVEKILEESRYLKEENTRMSKACEKLTEKGRNICEENRNIIEEISIYKAKHNILMEDLKEKENDKIALQESFGNLEMNYQSLQRNYSELNKTYETLIRESKAAEKIIEYKKKVENLVEEKLTLQNSNKLIIESLSNEIKELNIKINEMTMKTEQNKLLSTTISPQQTTLNSDSAKHPTQKENSIENNYKKVESQINSTTTNTDSLKDVKIPNIKETIKKPSGGFLTNIVKTLFLTETEKDKI